MLIRPELLALRGDDTPQRVAQHRITEVNERWREHSGAGIAEAELVRFADGAQLDTMPVLATLFAPGDPSAAELVAGLVAVHCAELAAQPLAQVTMRHFTNDVISTLILARHGNATLVLQAIDGTGLARKPVPETANFAPTETWEQILAGSAEVERVMLAGERHGRAELTREPMRLLPGMVCHRQGATEAQLLRRVSGVYVTLKLQRQTGGGGIMRQFRLSDGELLHQAAGSPRDSRLELTATLLGRMGRSDAAPLLAAMAEEEAATSLRWQALRECLALDSGKGFIALSRIASRLDDPLAAPAGALRAQLLEAYPRLATCKDGIHSCPV